MDDIKNNISLFGERSMCQMHLKQSRFIYQEFRSLTKIKDRIQKFKEAGGSRYI